MVDWQALSGIAVDDGDPDHEIAPVGVMDFFDRGTLKGKDDAPTGARKEGKAKMATNNKKLDDIMARLNDMADETLETQLYAMLYGNIGVGKTSLAMWLAQSIIEQQGGEILYIDSAAGWVSLKNVPSLMEGAHRLSFRGYEDLRVVADLIDRKVKNKKLDFGKIKVVVLDEIDSMADDTLDQTLREKHNTKDGDPTPEAEGRDYKPMGDLVVQAIKAFQRAGVHIILVAHDKERKDHRNVAITGPSLSPQLKKGVTGLMQVVGYVTAELKGTGDKASYERRVQAQPSRLVEAKTRVGALAERVKWEHDEFIDVLIDWLDNPEAMADDLNGIDTQTDDLPDDELPEDGIPAADTEDDEPVLVEAE